VRDGRLLVVSRPCQVTALRKRAGLEDGEDVLVRLRERAVISGTVEKAVRDALTRSDVPLSREDGLFGHIAVDRGWVTPEQIAEAVRRQYESSQPMRIGELLVKDGVLEDWQVQAILATQAIRMLRLEDMTVASMMQAGWTREEAKADLQAIRKRVQDALGSSGGGSR